ncbi:hypothetical protein TGME49_220720 [Toxoplasma gondii ME49]|uniref:Uncharacterized protein n=1 Tax=Toxoplasma gondii (strain ATCC 50611 / Me49) TaxID=508771 RepID=S8EQN3_TOXGM|nr:hypothetical protein TGME49_220720 [Toxoplasma gondii ME49]EPT24517.1 hypothetical protein TGME49_220720 [Toxoplasma gondii ME49]|eukprot:XP_018634749.1 hypothetical protein TGME49_220720 [Toxoplasma gondii ME49]
MIMSLDAEWQHSLVSPKVPCGGVAHWIGDTRSTRNAGEESVVIADDLPQLDACGACVVLSPTTREGVCQMTEAKDAGRHQEASVVQAHVVAAVEGDLESVAVGADERFITMRDTGYSL